MFNDLFHDELGLDLLSNLQKIARHRSVLQVSLESLARILAGESATQPRNKISVFTTYTLQPHDTHKYIACLSVTNDLGIWNLSLKGMNDNRRTSGIRDGLGGTHGASG